MNTKIKIFDYSLDFKMYSNLLLISGDSGCGKTTVYNYFKNRSYSDNKIVCFNSTIMNSNEDSGDELLFEQIRKCKDKCIVIDNADTLLGDKCRDFIGLDTDNNYIIFGNDVTGLFINPNRIAYLLRDDIKKEYILDYRYKK